MKRVLSIVILLFLFVTKESFANPDKKQTISFKDLESESPESDALLREQGNGPLQRSPTMREIKPDTDNADSENLTSKRILVISGVKAIAK